MIGLLNNSITGALGMVLAVFALLFGVPSLFFGRRLYWVFAGLAGFLAGLVLGPQWVSFPNSAQPWLAVVLGIILSAAALLIGRPLVVLSGGLALGLMGFTAAGSLPGWPRDLVIIALAVFGLLLAWRSPDWGVALISSISGGLLTGIALDNLVPSLRPAGLLLPLVLFLAGFAIQALEISAMRGRRKTPNLVLPRRPARPMRYDDPTAPGSSNLPVTGDEEKSSEKAPRGKKKS